MAALRRLLLLPALVAGCSTPRGVTPADSTAAAGAAVAADTATIARLEREARALARADGCEAVGGCRAAPVGARPCGGPRTYVVYCARTTDSVALYRKLDELKRVEQAYNEKQGLMGTCEFRTPPGLALSGGACRAAP